MSKNVLFKGGEGGRYRVQLTRRPLEVFVDLNPGATWGDYLDAVQAQLDGIGKLGVDHWCASSVKVPPRSTTPEDAE